MIHGVLNVYKERGFTSHDVVAKLRGMTHQKKIGHTGTLDPDAEGVLPICFGKATRLCDMLTDRSKEYRTVLLLGVETDTQDITGTVLSRHSVEGISETRLRACIEGYVGEYEQLPPMYSALKVQGQKLCDLARAGKTVERRKRLVFIHEIEIEEIDLPRVRMRVHCSKGTYIRTLCNDIGESLGCGGCMEALTRTRVGEFCVEKAVRLSEIEKVLQEHRFSDYLYSIDDMFPDCEKLYVKKEYDALAHNGNPLRAEMLFGAEGNTGKCRIYDSCGSFVGVYEKNRKESLFRPLKMFYAGGEGKCESSEEEKCNM